MSSEHCYFLFVNWIWNHLCKIFSLCLLIWLFVCLQARMTAVLKVYATSAAATDMGFLCVRTNWYGTRRGNCPEREAVLAVAAACQVWVVLCPTCHAHLPEPPRPTSLRPPTWSQPPQASPRKNNCVCLVDFCVTFMHVTSQLCVVVWCGFVQIFSCLWLEMSHLSSCSKSGYSSEEELWKALVLVGCFEKKLLGHNCYLHKDCCSEGSGIVAALKLHENRARHEYVCKNWEGRIR